MSRKLTADDSDGDGGDDEQQGDDEDAAQDQTQEEAMDDAGARLNHPRRLHRSVTGRQCELRAAEDANTHAERLHTLVYALLSCCTSRRSIPAERRGSGSLRRMTPVPAPPHQQASTRRM